MLRSVQSLNQFHLLRQKKLATFRLFIDLSAVDVSLVHVLSREFIMKTYVDSMKDNILFLSYGWVYNERKYR